MKKSTSFNSLHGIHQFIDFVSRQTGVDSIFGQGIERNEIHSNPDGSIYFKAEGSMFDMQNQSVGHYLGRMDPVPAFDFRTLSKPIRPARVPIHPWGAASSAPLIGHAEIDFVFNQQDRLSVNARETASLVVEPDGSRLFMISVMGVITGGVGLFDGAQGTQAACGTARLTPDMTLGVGTKLQFVTFYALQISARKRLSDRSMSLVKPHTQNSAHGSTAQPPSSYSPGLPPLGPIPSVGRVSPEEQAVRLALTGVEKINQRDLATYFDNYSLNVVLRGSTISKPIVGKAAATQWLGQFFQTFPNLHVTVDQCTASCGGHSASYIFTARGNRTVGFLGLPPTNTPFEFSGSTLIDIDASKGEVTTSSFFWDNLSIMQQLGFLSIPR